MKKLFAKLIAAVLTLVTLFSLSACGEVELGSDIERIKITITLEDTDGVSTDYEVEAKLYVDFAPETFNHIKGLIENGYYNGADVTNLTSTYFQFGDYSLSGGTIGAAKDANVQTVKGEFEKNGLVGNKLVVSQGAIILKRDSEGAAGVSKYNTGKATLAVALSSTAPFSVKEYCVFGQIVSDDGNKEADSSSVEYLSSLEKIMKVKDCLQDANGRKIYYCVKDESKAEDDGFVANWQGQTFTYAEYNDEYHYFKGVVADFSDAEAVNELMLTDEQAEDLASKLAVADNFRYIPVLKAVIKSIVIL